MRLRFSTCSSVCTKPLRGGIAGTTIPRCLSLCRWLRVSERAFDRLIFIATVYHVSPKVQRRVADHFLTKGSHRCQSSSQHVPHRPLLREQPTARQADTADRGSTRALTGVQPDEFRA